MRIYKKLCLTAGVAVASVFASGSTADAQVVYNPYYGYNFGYPYGYGARSFSYSVTNPNGASVGYSVTTAPGYYGGYGVSYGAYPPYPYAWSTPQFGRGSYTYNYPGVFYSPGSYTFFGY
jgi:hypothetical protein